MLKYYFPTKGRGQTCLGVCTRIIGWGHKMISTIE